MADEARPPQHWWNVQIERRLDALQVSQESVWKELREEIRRTDRQADAIQYIDKRVEEMRRDMDAVRKEIREELLTREDFKPYRNAVVTIASAVGLAILGAILRLVIGGHQ